jgi:hypothetical protein
MIEDRKEASESCGPSATPAPNAGRDGHRQDPASVERGFPAVSQWFSPPGFSLFLGLLLVATYSGVVLGTHSFFFRDYGVLSYPIIFYQHESFWRGELPLWNPYSHCGVPFLAQWGTMVLYPFSLIYLLLPLPWSLGLFCIVHLFLAGLGVYFLAGRWLDNRFAAGVAGVAFVLNGVVFSSLIWPNYTVALGWMPWVVLLTEAAWREGGRNMVLAALAGAMQMMSGVPEIILLTWLLVGLFWAAETIRGTGQPAKRFVRFPAVILMVAALALVQLLPFFDLLAHSQRHSGYGTSAWSMPGWGWANLLLPLFRCARSAQGVFFQPGHIFIVTYYLGIGVLALAIFGAWRVRHLRVWLLTAATLFSLIMALGDDGYLFRWIRLGLPQLGFARYPIKFIYLALFTIPLLAACAIDAVQRSPAVSWRQTRGQLVLLWGVVLGLVGALAWFAWKTRVPSDQWPATGLNALARAATLSLTLGAVLLLRRVRRRWLEFGVQIGIIAIVWLDAQTYAPHLHPTIRASAFAPALAKLDGPPRLGEARAMISPWAEDRMYRSRVPDFTEDFLGKRLGLWMNLHLLDGVPKVEGGSTLQLREQAEVQARLYAPSGEELPRLAEFLAVSHVTAPDKIVEWVAHTNHMPWVSAGQKPAFVEATQSLDLITAPEFEPRRIVYLPKEAQPFVQVTNITQAQIFNQDFGRHRVRFEVEASEPCMVVIAQSFYHPWRARVDGQPTRLWRANHAFQALQAPAGCHRVELVYEDRNLRFGGIVSGLTLTVCLVGLAWRRARRN